MMRVALLLSVLLAACTFRESWPDPSTWKPGQALSEHSTSLGKGYREVHESRVNPPGHWEGVGHFAVIYYNDTRLCQCSAGDVAISPDGKFVVYADDQNSGRLTLFSAATSSKKPVSDKFIGTPHGAEWDLAHGRAVVHLREWNNTKNAYDERDVEVTLGDKTP